MTELNQIEINKPSEALQHAYDGLNMFENNPNFKIDMDTFGSLVLADNEKFCFGCMATAASFKLLDIKNKEENIESINRRENYGDIFPGIEKFEYALNDYRLGGLFYFLGSFGVDLDLSKKIAKELSHVVIRNDNWKEVKELIKDDIEVLKKYGL